MKATLRTLGFILLLVVTCDGASPVKLVSRSGYVGSAPTRFKFQTTIEFDSKNRMFCLEWASPEVSGNSCEELNTTLDPDKPVEKPRPLTIWRDVTFRRGGEYNVIAVVRRSDNVDVVSNIETIRILDALGQ